MGDGLGRRHVIRRPAVLALMAVALLLVFALAVPIAGAFPVFNQGQSGVPACETCHSQTQVHGVTAHAPQLANPPASCTASCHTSGSTANPPTPADCAGCHGAANILAGTTHVATGCASTPGCHGVPAAGATITAINPPKAPVNTTVTVTGTGFGATAGTLNFGTTAATATSWTATKIVTKVPATLAVGAVDVTVTPDGGTASPAFSFTVTQAVTSQISLRLVGVKSGILRFGRTVTAAGIVKPFHAAKVTITFQRRTTKWITVKKVTRLSNATTGTYSFKYKPLRKGAWRVMSKVAKVTIGTNTYSAAQTTWKTFRVR